MKQCCKDGSVPMFGKAWGKKREYWQCMYCGTRRLLKSFLKKNDKTQ